MEIENVLISGPCKSALDNEISKGLKPPPPSLHPLGSTTPTHVLVYDQSHCNARRIGVKVVTLVIQHLASSPKFKFEITAV